MSLMLRSFVARQLPRRCRYHVHQEKDGVGWVKEGVLQGGFSKRCASTLDIAGSAFQDVSTETSRIIYRHAHHPQTPLSLQTLLQTGRGEFLHKSYKRKIMDDPSSSSSSSATEQVLMQVAGFLRREIPIRLAHRIQDLDRVPYLRDMPSVHGVKQLYIQSLLELDGLEPKITSPELEHQFSQSLERIYDRHSKVLVQMARGALEFRDAIRKGKVQVGQHEIDDPECPSNTGVTFEQMESTHTFLDRFYLCRIGIRMLIGQYLALRQPPVPHYTGIICSQTSPYEIVKRAIDDAAFMCNHKYGEAPEVLISGKLEQTFPYVPTHLHYILLELLKNSMRATMDWHYRQDEEVDLPPIKVVIADGQDNEDVIIKVSDEGGGIPRSNMKKIWSYLFTTADPAIQEGMVGLGGNDSSTIDHGINSPLAGLGYGLPISRSYCRYFGGDLSIMSMEGHGTDAFVYLTRLGTTREPLPI